MNAQVKKQAEECAKIDYKKDGIKIFVDGFLKGYEYATQWHSPDEKPDRKTQNERQGILIQDIYDVIHRGWYDIMNGNFMKYSTEIIKLSEVKKWQYLPKIVK